MNAMSRAAVLAVCLCIATACARVTPRRPRWHQLSGYAFEDYVSDYGKKYPTDAEWAARRANFEATLSEVMAFNALPGMSYKKGINHMSDWTTEERKRLNGGRLRAAKHLHTLASPAPPAFMGSDIPLRPTVDYRNAVPAVLSSVKDQGQCGSCWAHGSTEQIESYTALATGNLNVLSQQQLTSCSLNPDDCGGFGGCKGSTAELAYQYVMGAGQTQEWQYPYESYSGNQPACSTQLTTNSFVNVTGYVTLPTNSLGPVMAALQLGPLAVNVDASNWFTYESGIFTGCSYNESIDIDHVVQLVGYGFDDGLMMGYWIVRNSWNTAYGEHGYIRLYREDGEPGCGMDDTPLDGFGCKGAKPMQVCGMCGILADSSYPIVGM